MIKLLTMPSSTSFGKNLERSFFFLFLVVLALLLYVLWFHIYLINGSLFQIVHQMFSNIYRVQKGSQDISFYFGWCCLKILVLSWKSCLYFM